MATPKKQAPKPEITREEAETFVQPESVDKGKKVGTTKKTVVNDALVDVVENERYPRHAVSENYQVEVTSPLTSVPIIRVSPRNWVGPVPLTLPEARLDELIELLTKVR